MTSPTGRRDLEAWYRELRETFLAVARSRVPTEDAEDLVQDALRVVHERGDSIAEDRLIEGLPPVAWCLQVLRFTIGNYYKRNRTRRGVIADGVASEGRTTGPQATPLEALEQRERLALLERGLAELSAADARCARYLDHLLDGATPRELARQEDVEETVLYRRVYRCRQKLKKILKRLGATR